MFLPGVQLNSEEVCRLQAQASCHRTGHPIAVAGKRMLSMYRVAEVPMLASGSTLYLFDPSGRYIASPIASNESSIGENSSNDGDQLPLARGYPLVPADLPRRFPDQFAPLSMFGFRPSAGLPLDGTLLRLPLRSHLQAAHSKVSHIFWSASRMRSLLQALRKDASTLLLGLRCVEVLSTSDWLPKLPDPTRTLQVSLCLPQSDAMQRGSLSRDTSWKSSSILSMFSKPAKRDNLYLVDVAQVSTLP